MRPQVRDNVSSPDGFVLVGFSDRPRLELVLFVVVLAFYLLTLLGNVTIILLSALAAGCTHHVLLLGQPLLPGPVLHHRLHPQMLYNLRARQDHPLRGRAARLFLVLALGGVGRVLLAVTACQPLRYALLLRQPLRELASLARRSGCGNSLTMTPQTLELPRCGHRRVDHFLCEMPALIGMACVDTAALEALAFAWAIVIVLVPLALILVSYGHIARAVRRIRSAAGRQKAFHTCSAHLAVVALFYGTTICMYLQPATTSSQDQGKFLTLLYTVVTPSVNPLIYTLRNKVVKQAMKKVLGKGVPR